MKKLLAVLAAVVFTMSFSSIGNGQAYYDTSSFTISALIKPSDYSQWPDSVGAWKVYGTFDLDKDGKKEFLVLSDPATTAADTNMPSVYRFEATGNNSYALVWTAKMPGTNSARFSFPDLTVADMDGDGNQEIFVAVLSSGASRDLSTTPNPPRVIIYEYEPALGNFSSSPTMTTNLAMRDNFRYRPTRIIVDNIDTDPDLEMILTSRGDDFGGLNAGRTLTVFHLIGDISEGFSSFEMEFIDSSAVLKGGAVYDLGVVDFDGDGKKEIWVATWDMLSIAIYEATGANTYALQADINKATDPHDIGLRNAMKFYDANKDGKLEMFSAGITGDGVNPGAVFYIGNVSDVATLTINNVKRISPWIDATEYGGWSLDGGDVGDIDGDGKVDYVTVGAGTIHRKLYRLEYKSGAYDDTLSYTWDSVYYAMYDSTYHLRNVLIANDIDGDSKKEVLIANMRTRNGFPDAAVIILESKVATLGVKQVSDIVPNAFTLEQNFPNPFNPTSTIRFSLKQSGDVQLIITNVLGQKVGSLLNGKVSAGTHEVTFNADGLASGTYFYTLKSGNFVETKKMILQK